MARSSRHEAGDCPHGRQLRLPSGRRVSTAEMVLGDLPDAIRVDKAALPEAETREEGCYVALSEIVPPGV